jgi:replicative DNA helicase
MAADRGWREDVIRRHGHGSSFAPLQGAGRQASSSFVSTIQPLVFPMNAPSENADRLSLPHAVEAEREILAAALVDPNSLDTIVEHEIGEEDFYVSRHGMVFAAMRRVHERHGTIDEVTLAQQMKDMGTWEEAGASRTLSELLDRAGTTSHLTYYCKIVRDKALARRMVEAARTIEIDGLTDTDDVASYLDEAEAAIFGVLENRGGATLKPAADVVKSAFEQISAAYDSDDSVVGLATGYRDLDDLTHGLQRGDLVVLAARPGMGKTAFVLNLACNTALRKDASVALFSLEMPGEQLVNRMMASEARINLEKLRSGQLAEDEWPKLTNVADQLSQSKLYIDDTPGITPGSIRAKCRRLKRRGGLDLVIVDYLQLMSSGQKEQSREQEISRISRSLKGLAKSLSVPVIALSQLNRGVESRTDKRPMISDLRESGAIEQDADLIAFIYREDRYKTDIEESERGIAELIIGKHRNGPTGVVKLKWWGAWTRFDNLSQREDSSF